MFRYLYYVVAMTRGFVYFCREAKETKALSLPWSEEEKETVSTVA